MRLLLLRRGSRRRPLDWIDVLYDRDGSPAKRIVEQWMVTLLHVREVLEVRFSYVGISIEWLRFTGGFDVCIVP